MDVLFDVYDATGEVNVGDTAVTVGLDTERSMNSLCSLASNEIAKSISSSIIIPNSSLNILILCRVGLYASSGNSRSQARSWLELDIGSGYDVVPGTYSYGYIRNADAGYCTMPIDTSFSLSKASFAKLRIRAERIEGTNVISTLANATSIIGIVLNNEF